MSKRAFASLFVVVFLLGAFLRTSRLGLRPMHHDEANQAVKFGQLLEEGKYRYDPADHHGPSLYYLSLPFAKLLSGGSFAGLSETTLRLVTATFGLGTMLLLLLLVPMLGRTAVAWAALALAISPAMVYFSRFYIQETLLVFFIVAFAVCVWRYLRRPGWGWAAGAGAAAGLMYATKETSVIAFAAAAAALIASRPWRGATRKLAAGGVAGRGSGLRETAELISDKDRPTLSRTGADNSPGSLVDSGQPGENRSGSVTPASELTGSPLEDTAHRSDRQPVGLRIEMADEIIEPPRARRGRERDRSARAERHQSAWPPAWFHALLALGIALGVAFLFFSSFLRNPRGFLDSVKAFGGYFERAGGAGLHAEPWHYYLGKLTFAKGPGGVVSSEGLILLLALVGAAAAFGWKRRVDAPGASIEPEQGARPASSLEPNKEVVNVASLEPHVNLASGLQRPGPNIPPIGGSFPIFVLAYSVLAAIIFSAIPYKTPWNLLPFYIGFIILAGIGASFLISLPRQRNVRIAIAALIAAGFVELAVQSYRANLVYPADERNPYAYAQTSPDFLRLVRRIQDLAPLAPEGRAMLIKVVAGPYETWPLPWYLRRFSRVGYWTSAAAAGDIDRPAVVIASAREAAALEPALSTSYRSEYYGLRPGVLLTLSVRNDLWEALLKERAR